MISKLELTDKSLFCTRDLNEDTALPLVLSQPSRTRHGAAWSFLNPAVLTAVSIYQTFQYYLRFSNCAMNPHSLSEHCCLYRRSSPRKSQTNPWVKETENKKLPARFDDTTDTVEDREFPLFTGEDVQKTSDTLQKTMWEPISKSLAGEIKITKKKTDKTTIVSFCMPQSCLWRS